MVTFKKKKTPKNTYLHFILLFAKWTEADVLFSPFEQWPIKRHHSWIWYKSINAKYDSLQSHEREAQHKVNLKIELLNTVNLVCFSNIYIIMCLNWRSNRKTIMVTWDTTVLRFQCVTLVLSTKCPWFRTLRESNIYFPRIKIKVRWFWQYTRFYRQL